MGKARPKADFCGLAPEQRLVVRAGDFLRNERMAAGAPVVPMSVYVVFAPFSARAGDLTRIYELF